MLHIGICHHRHKVKWRQNAVNFFQQSIVKMIPHFACFIKNHSWLLLFFHRRPCRQVFLCRHPVLSKIHKGPKHLLFQFLSNARNRTHFHQFGVTEYPNSAMQFFPS